MDAPEAQRRLDSYSPKDQPLIEQIDTTLAEYEAYKALDHELAIAGTVNYLRALREAQNGYDRAIPPTAA